MYIKLIQSETASYYLTAFQASCVHSCPHIRDAQVRTWFLTSARCWWETQSRREHFSCVCFHCTFFYTCGCVCAWCHNEGHSVCFPRHAIRKGYRYAAACIRAAGVHAHRPHVCTNSITSLVLIVWIVYVACRLTLLCRARSEPGERHLYGVATKA